MEKSKIMFYVAGYMAVIAYILAIVGELKGYGISGLAYIHLAGTVVFCVLSALFVFAEEYNKKETK